MTIALLMLGALAMMAMLLCPSRTKPRKRPAFIEQAGKSPSKDRLEAADNHLQ